MSFILMEKTAYKVTEKSVLSMLSTLFRVYCNAMNIRCFHVRNLSELFYKVSIKICFKKGLAFKFDVKYSMLKMHG